MRQTCMDMVYELAKQDPRVLFIGSDLGVGTLDEFKNYLAAEQKKRGIYFPSTFGSPKKMITVLSFTSMDA